MNNIERLQSHYRMYSWLKELTMKGCTFYDEEDSDWLVIENRYPELPMFIEDLLSHLESYVKREQELFDVENHILWVDYRDYKFKIFLDAERNTLVGDLLLNNELDITGLESDSLTHLLTELEREVDSQINYKYQSQLAKENIQLQDRVRELEKDLEKLKLLEDNLEWKKKVEATEWGDTDSFNSEEERQKWNDIWERKINENSSKK